MTIDQFIQLGSKLDTQRMPSLIILQDIFEKAFPVLDSLAKDRLQIGEDSLGKETLVLYQDLGKKGIS